MAAGHFACIRSGSTRVASRWSELLPEPLLECRVQQVPWQQGGGERGGREQRVELLIAPARFARGEHDLDEDLFAPFAHLCLDHRPGAGDSAVAGLPVADQVGDRAEVSVDGELVAVRVVARGLIFEVADRAGSVAGGDPGNIGKIDDGGGPG